MSASLPPPLKSLPHAQNWEEMDVSDLTKGAVQIKNMRGAVRNPSMT